MGVQSMSSTQMVKSPNGSTVIQSPISRQIIYPGQLFQANQSNVSSQSQIHAPPVLINNMIVKQPVVRIVQGNESTSNILDQGQIHIQSPSNNVIAQQPLLSTIVNTNNQQVLIAPNIS